MTSRVICIAKRRGSLIEASFWLACLFAWSSISFCRGEDVNCCKEGTTWAVSTNCSDGSSIRVDCPFGLYRLDPEMYEYDNFSIHEAEDGTWLIHDGHRVPSDRYCLVDTHDGKAPIALRCFEDTVGESVEWRNALFSALSIISAVFLIITLMVYVILPELREIQDKALMATVMSLTVSYMILSIQHMKAPDNEGANTICISLGFLMYYAFVSTFFWLNIVAFNIWRSVWFKSFAVKDNFLFKIYCVIGWGAPMCFLAASIVTDYTEGTHLKPHFGERTCFFSGIAEMWAFFYGPISVLLALNIIYLGLTSWRLWHEYREYNGNKLRVLRFRCMLYFKLILVMGITWIFEVLSFAAGSRTNEYWIPTDILNALQGLVIFLLLVATRKRVRKLLAKKKPCGISFPKSWVAYEDEECEEVVPEELRLSQQA